MPQAGRKWQLVTGFTAALCLGSAAAGYSQFTSFNDRSRSILEGHWQSCREDDGQYAERVYDGKAPGIGPFELHMGPYHEFALFRGVQDEHRGHNSAENLLRPYTVEVSGSYAKQVWDAAGLRLEVALAGGSLGDCESWFVTLRRPTRAPHIKEARRHFVSPRVPFAGGCPIGKTPQTAPGRAI